MLQYVSTIKKTFTLNILPKQNNPHIHHYRITHTSTIPQNIPAGATGLGMGLPSRVCPVGCQRSAKLQQVCPVSVPLHFQLLFMFTQGGIATPSFSHQPVLCARGSQWELQDGSNGGGRGSGDRRHRRCRGGVFHQPAHRESQRLVSNTHHFLCCLLRSFVFVVLPAISCC
jgi:hypothetical protein